MADPVAIWPIHAALIGMDLTEGSDITQWQRADVMVVGLCQCRKKSEGLGLRPMNGWVLRRWAHAVWGCARRSGQAYRFCDGGRRKTWLLSRDLLQRLDEFGNSLGELQDIKGLLNEAVGHRVQELLGLLGVGSSAGEEHAASDLRGALRQALVKFHA